MIRFALPALLLLALAAPAFAQAPQAELDARALELRAHPEIAAARERLLAALRADPVSASVGERLDDDADEIVLGAIQDNINRDRGCPVFYRYFAPAHEMNSLHIPTAKLMMTNPDTVFRYVAIDPKGLTRIEGHFGQPRSAYLSFHVDDGSYADVGKLFDSDLEVDEDGRFVVTVGPADAEGKAANHLAVGPNARRVFVRDTIGDGSRENPTVFSVRRLDAARCEAHDDAEIVARALAAIDAMPERIAAFRDRGFLSRPPNSIASPAVYPGSDWAKAAYGRFDLADGEVMVIHLYPQGARYMGVQTSDRATGTIAPEARPSTLNSLQAVPDADGGFTMLLAPADPGWSNWIDTGGVAAGQIWVRWQGLSDSPFDAGRAVSARVVRREGLADAVKGTALRRVPPEERAAQYQRHRADYARRF